VPPTTWGAAPFKDRALDADAAVVEALAATGAVLVAKLATVELAGGFGYNHPDAAWTGPGRNARDPERWAGGSSSGSGAAVAAGLIPFALGSETWGSITNPACLNGVVGFRPTYGLVSRRGVMALSWTMDKIGPLALTADDCRSVLVAVAGADPEDPTTLLARPIQPDERRSGFRFAVLRGATEGVEPEVAANFRASVDLLSAFGDIEEIDLPDLPYDEAAAVVIQAEAAAAFEEFIASGAARRLTAPEDRYGLLDGLTLPAVDYLRALRVRRVAGRALDATLVPFDAVVAPTQPKVAPPLAEQFDSFAEGSETRSLGAAGNLCGLPAATVPNGAGRLGLPTGLELMGRAGSDGTVLAAAAAFERALADRDGAERGGGSSHGGRRHESG
jgi:aspartyl-tRNA(Asn)/glutamyl-tRNA(Gln) amidotransferase subunit A